MKILSILWRKRRKNESLIRYVSGLLHLWLGVFVGVVISFISITGALYVFSNEYDDIENRKYVKNDHNSERTASIDDMVVDFQSFYSQEPGKIFVPIDQGQNMTIANWGFGDERIKAYVDPISGEYLGTAGNTNTKFSFAVIRLHRWLNFEDMNVGRKIIGVSTFIFIFLLVSGLVIWFPRSIKTAKHQFKVQFKRNFQFVNRQWHVNLGFYLTLALLVIAITGTTFTFPSVRQAVVGLFSEEPRAAENLRSDKALNSIIRDKYRTDTLSFENMLEASNEILGYKSDINIYYPSRRFKEYSVIAVNPDNFLGGTWADVVTFDLQGNYKTTYFFEDMSLRQQMNQLMRPIHTGEIFGTKSKIFYLLMALFSAFLPISGIIIWWKRISKKILKKA